MIFSEGDLPTLVSESYLFLQSHNQCGEQVIVAVLASLLLLVLYVFYLDGLDKTSADLPWAGRRTEVLAKFRAGLREYRSGWATLQEGHDKVSQRYRTITEDTFILTNSIVWKGWTSLRPPTVEFSIHCHRTTSLSQMDDETTRKYSFGDRCTARA